MLVLYGDLLCSLLFHPFGIVADSEHLIISSYLEINKHNIKLSIMRPFLNEHITDGGL